jgi:hypothetical protein
LESYTWCGAAIRWLADVLQLKTARRRSIVAIIVDARGGTRVVVTEPWNLEPHVGEGEKCHVVPDLWINDEIGLRNAPRVIAEAEARLRAVQAGRI